MKRRKEKRKKEKEKRKKEKEKKKEKERGGFRQALFQGPEGSVFRNVLRVNGVRCPELFQKAAANEPACRSTRACCMCKNGLKVLGTRVPNEVHSLLLVVWAMQQDMANRLGLPATAARRENVWYTYRRQPGIQTDYLRTEEHKGRGAMFRQIVVEPEGASTPRGIPGCGGFAICSVGPPLFPLVL